MKNTIISLFILCLINIAAFGQAEGKQKNNPAGNWKFDAPNAPEGYTSGIITINLTEEKYSTTMTFTGMEYKFIGEKVRMVQDSVYFSVYIEGEDVKISLKQEKEAKMSGKAVYSEGVVPLNLTKEALESEKK